MSDVSHSSFIENFTCNIPVSVSDTLKTPGSTYMLVRHHEDPHRPRK
jgi:hypothetical protein